MEKKDDDFRLENNIENKLDTINENNDIILGGGLKIDDEHMATNRC